MGNQETREKILKTAKTLFALKGFKGTSIRDIAQEAGVNVASINYYFKNKQCLFEENLVNCHEEARKKIINVLSQCKTTEEAVIKVTYSFIEDAHNLKTSFKTIILDESQEHYPENIGTEDEMVGPPGGKALMEFISNESEHNFNEEDLTWAVQVLITEIIHTALIRTSSACCQRKAMKKFMTDEYMEYKLKRLTRAVLREIGRE